MKYEPMAGEAIEHAANGMVAAAQDSGEQVTASFNDIELIATPNSTPGQVVDAYTTESQRRNDEYVNSDVYRQREAAAKIADEQRAASLKGALLFAPSHLTIADGHGDEWLEIVGKNSDPYGACTVRYAEVWARLMEGRMANGDTVEGCADEASHLADTEGITGFMYGCAVSILARVWIHGDALRRWHNLKTQIRNEGEAANENGGVLNPAILGIE